MPAKPVPKERTTHGTDLPPANLSRLCIMRTEYGTCFWLHYLMDREAGVPYVEDGRVWYAQTDAQADAKRQALRSDGVGAGACSVDVVTQPRKSSPKRARKTAQKLVSFRIP